MEFNPCLAGIGDDSHFNPSDSQRQKPVSDWFKVGFWGFEFAMRHKRIVNVKQQGFYIPLLEKGWGDVQYSVNNFVGLEAI